MVDSNSESESSDEEKQMNDLRQLEEAVDEDDEPADDCSDFISKLSPADQQHYENIRTAIGLNKLMNEKLIKFEKQLILRLKECRERLAALHADSRSKGPEKTQVFRYVVCGKPYFKDRDFYPPPDNQDTITMRKAGMYEFSDAASVTGWTVKDKSQFYEKVLEMSRKFKKDELLSKLAEAKRLLKVDSKSPDELHGLKKRIRQMEKDLNAVDKLPLAAVVKPIEEDYDWDAISDALNNRHTPLEYKAFWKLFLHPSINKKNWTKAEHCKLNEIIHEHRLQDWDAIAEHLGTGRTAYQCFVYFRTNMNNNMLGAKWTKEEEEYLRRLIEYYSEDEYIPWGKVAASMENRTKTQIYNKFKRLTESRKGRFLPEEDAVLLTCVEHFGPIWRKIVTYLPGRSMNQVRKRFEVLTNYSKASVVWTADEDKKLLQLLANQDSKSVNYSPLTEHFPSKTRIQLRARHLTLIKWMKRHPNKDIELAPRRGARRLTHGESLKDLNTAVENLKLRLETDIETVKIKKVTSDSPEETIDHAIVNFLITETTREEALKKQIAGEQSVSSNGEATWQKNENDIKKILLLLKAKLKKNLFVASEYNNKYPSLTIPDMRKPFLKVKCYSKKNSTNLVPFDDGTEPISIWGNPIFVSEYVLPPSYATIIGCRRLMALASDNKPILDSCINVKQIVRRNSTAKEQVELFMDRFTALFLWPILLSDYNPKYSEVDAKVAGIPGLKFGDQWERKFQTPSVIIPRDEVVRSTTDSDKIDLDETVDDGELTVKSYVGSDDFMYMDI